MSVSLSLSLSLTTAGQGPVEATDLLSKLLEFEETNKLDSDDPIVVRKQNQPQRIHELSQLKMTPPQSDEEEEYHYQSGDEQEEGDEDGDDDLQLALEMSQKPFLSDFPSVAPTPSQPEPTALLPFGVLEDEPSPTDSNITKISFRLPFVPAPPSATIRRFSLSSPVEQLYCYLFSLLPDDQRHKRFDLLSPFPRESLQPKLSCSLAEAGLAGSQIIMKWEE
jgi:hypothetical protein